VTKTSEGKENRALMQSTPYVEKQRNLRLDILANELGVTINDYDAFAQARAGYLISVIAIVLIAIVFSILITGLVMQ
jgi:hypothetical protein